jgi:uncharacterized protein
MARSHTGRAAARLLPIVAALTLAAMFTGGCATYSDRMTTTHQLAARNDYGAALASLNRQLGVRSADELPSRWKSDTGLLLLERAVIQQALGRHEGSARDLRAAEARLETLDLSADPVGKLARFLYSDSAPAYRIPPAEQLALNPLNMLNYLAMDDLQGAAVEARRFTVIRDYLDQTHGHTGGRLGSFLAGYVFEQLGDPERALRYYEEALAGGHLNALRQPVRQLSTRTPYRGRHIQSLLDHTPPTDDADLAQHAPHADLLIIVNVGRAPHKVPERMPVGLAVGIAGTLVTGNTEWLTRSAAKVIVYPELVESRGTFAGASASLSGRPVQLELLADVSEEVRADYERMKPTIIAAALTRLLARAATAEGIRAATRGAGPEINLLSALAAELSMVALDRPDTRSWTFLPGRVMVARLTVPPGRQTLHLRMPSGPDRAMTLNVAAGSSRVIVITNP